MQVHSKSDPAILPFATFRSNSRPVLLSDPAMSHTFSLQVRTPSGVYPVEIAGGSGARLAVIHRRTRRPAPALRRLESHGLAAARRGLRQPYARRTDPHPRRRALQAARRRSAASTTHSSAPPPIAQRRSSPSAAEWSATSPASRPRPTSAASRSCRCRRRSSRRSTARSAARSASTTRSGRT